MAIDKIGSNFYIGSTEPTHATFTLPVSAIYLDSKNGILYKHLGKNKYKEIIKDNIIENLINWTNSRYVYVNDDITAYNGQTLLVDTKDKDKVITITLDHPKEDLAKIRIIDYVGNFNKKSCIVKSTGDDTIMGDDEGIELDIKNINITLFYRNNEWRII